MKKEGDFGNRGMLLPEETLKIVIALICIAFLAFFLGALYFNGVKNQKTQQAQQTLINSDQSIKSVIDNLQSGMEKSIGIVEPVGWNIYSFTGDEPDSCTGENCICICDSTTISSQTNECTKNGACLIVKNVRPFNPINIQPKAVTNISIKNENGEIIFNLISAQNVQDGKGTETNTEGSQRPQENTPTLADSGAQKVSFTEHPVQYVADIWDKFFGLFTGKQKYGQEDQTAVVGVKG